MSCFHTGPGAFAHLGRAIGAVLTLLLVIMSTNLAIAAEPGTPGFLRTWERPDRPVGEGLASRTWMWGPEANTTLLTEEYLDAPRGARDVQYFDKARMEDNGYRADGPPWDVTNGLLVVELITGRLQLGDVLFEQYQPARVNVAGDADDPTGPTYATLDSLLDAAPRPVGEVITERIDRTGAIVADPALAGREVTAAFYDDVTRHTIAGPFWAFMNSNGLVYQDGQAVHGQLFENPYFATGRPITEAYWANVKVAGTYQDVLLQCFERRCLTYTPSNSDGWQVEAGNVGQHYYAWRYGQLGDPVDEATQPPAEDQPGDEPPADGPPADDPPVDDPPVDDPPMEEPPIDEPPDDLPEAPDYITLAAWGGRLRDGTAFDAPRGIATNAYGYIFIVDSKKHRVQKYSSNGELLLIWGEKGKREGQFNEPRDITVGPDGSVYVADTTNDRIQVFDQHGKFMRSWDGADTPAGKLFRPGALAINSRGEVYVADTNNHRVVWFSRVGDSYGLWYGDESDAGPFAFPFGIAVDKHDQVYLLDSGNSRIVRYGGGGEYLGEWGSIGSEPGEFRLPQAIAINDTDNVFVADSLNRRIQRFTITGTYLGEWDGAGTDAGEFRAPAGIAIDPAGNVLIADTGNNRIVKVGQHVAYHHATFHFDWSDGRRGRFGHVNHLASDPDGNVYVFDCVNSFACVNRVQMFSQNGRLLNAWEVGPEGGVDQGTTHPGGIAFDPRGFVYVAITESHRIVKYTASGEYVLHWGEHGDGDGQLSYPRGLEVDDQGNVYVVDGGNHRVQKFTGDGQFLGQWGAEGSDAGEFEDPEDIAIHGGSVYVVDVTRHRVQQFDLDGAFIRQWGGLGSTPGKFRNPFGIDISAEGLVYVTDNGNDRVQIFTLDGVYLADMGRIETEDGYAGIDLTWPRGIAVSDQGYIYIFRWDPYGVVKLGPRPTLQPCEGC